MSGGSEAVESAWKLARQHYLARGEPRRWKAVSRHIAYHGTTMGALSINGIPELRTPFEPLVPEVQHVRNTNRYHRPADETEEQFTAFLLDDLTQTIEATGPETIAMVIMEPVQNAGGAFTPPEGYWRGVREVCDRYGILLCADEVITGFGRLGAWFGSERYDIRPDLITMAKGLSSSYAAIGAVAATDRVMEPFMQGTNMYAHGITFGGHPVMSAIALKNIEIIKRDGIIEHVAETQQQFRSTLEQLLDLPIAGDLRGTGFFYALELVKDKETRESFNEQECETLLRGFLSPAAVRAWTHLPVRRPRRSRRADLPAARGRRAGVRPDRLDPRRRARRGVDACVDDDRREREVTARRPTSSSTASPKRFDDVVAVDDLSLDVESGSFFALLGPSGCGKTTTLRMIGGFEQPTEGHIYLGEREVSGLPAYKRDVNTVFQSYALFPHLSVFENVAFGLRRRPCAGRRCVGVSRRC